MEGWRRGRAAGRHRGWAGQWLLAAVAAAWLTLGLDAAAHAAEARVALVIGVASYKPPVKALANPVSDAAYVAEALRHEGFKVDVLTNPGRSQLLDALASFSQRSENAEAAIIYYAGHGVEVDGVNYLLPADVRSPNDVTSANASRSADSEVSRAMKAIFTDTAVKAARARDAVVGATRVRLLILDACRDDPFDKDEGERGLEMSGGLARESGGSATRVVTLMAAGPGKIAYDGQMPRHSPFAEALVDAIQRPGMTIGDLPIAVQTAVEESTRLQHTVQSPDQQGIFRDTRWTFGVVSSSSGPAAPDAESLAQNRLAREQAFWQTARNSSDPADLQAYLDKVQAGEFTGLFKPLALNRLRSLQHADAAPKAAAPVAGPAPPTLQYRARGREAYSKGDYLLAIEAWTQAAKAGDSTGAYNLGVMALTGRGQPKDLSVAARWFETAAKAGHAGAMANYGLCLLNGYGVAKDEQAAVSWLRRSADQGLPFGMALMGEVYLRGVGLNRNPAQAMDWLGRASEAGDGPAMVRLAELLEAGTEVPADLRRAFALYRRAALAGQPEAMVKVGYFYEDGSTEAPDLLQAATWYQRAADAGDAEGMSSLGVLLENGKGLAKDEAAAARYYGMAADKKDPRGLLGLGGLYARGAGVPQDDVRAAELFRKASEAGSAAGARNLAVMYEVGRGVPRDLAAAERLYKQAAAGGETDAVQDLARLSRR